MTDKEQRLLTQDLCARLPYGVKVSTLGGSCKLLISVDIKHGFLYLDNGDYVAGEYSIDDIKPYLRSMENMTEEEYECFVDILKRSMVRHKCYDWHEQWIQTPSLEEWLNTHHFDYRGLIPMGLALEAPEGMYDN